MPSAPAGFPDEWSLYPRTTNQQFDDLLWETETNCVIAAAARREGQDASALNLKTP